MSKKSVVVYYSVSGNTRTMAEKIKEITGADIGEILPLSPYPTSYTALLNEAKKDIQQGVKPPIYSLDLSGYDVIYVGSPVWWGTIAPPVITLLDENNLSGKIIAPFVTHGGGGKDHSDRDVEKFSKGAKVTKMLEVYGDGGRNSEKVIEQWLKDINL